MRSSVDAIVVRDNRVFAYGWAYSPKAAINKLRLDLLLVDGEKVQLPVSFGKLRDDVEQAFPGELNSRNSGWMVYSAWEGAAAKSIALSGEFDDGSAVSTLLYSPVQAQALAVAPMTFISRVAARARCWFGNAKEVEVVQPVYTAPEATDHVAYAIDCVRRELSEANQSRCTLIIDHTMGGGANLFSKQWMSARAATQPVMLRLSFDIPSLRFSLNIVLNDRVERFYFSNDQIVRELSRLTLIDEVFYNDAVSFPRPEAVPVWLSAFKRDLNIKLTIAVHDYLAICPSQFLLNDEGRFCAVPDLSECEWCLPRNENEFAPLFAARSISDWRRRWSAALFDADEIICFSASSKNLLLRAYPDLAENRVRVQPHRVQPFVNMPLIDRHAPLHLGVVGAINFHKGARVIQALAAEIARQKLPVRITVIGSIEVPCDTTVLNSTGPFDREALPDLMEEAGVNLCFLPSICPETFSYVTEEIMSLRMPLACFNLGAPADRVRAYEFGRVISCQEAGPLLESLQQFHQQLSLASFPQSL